MQLTEAELAAFGESGYHVFSGVMGAAEVADLRDAVDAHEAEAAVVKAEIAALVAKGGGTIAEAVRADPALGAAIREAYARVPAPYRQEAIGRLTHRPGDLELVDQVMAGEPYTFHHVHAFRMDEGHEGVNWHQDYEQLPQTNRSHTMVHIFHYLDGLNGRVGDLLLRPGSHTSVMDRTALWFMGTADLPGSLVVDDLPPGSAVLVHSALLHGRRPKPGAGPRYFVDTSFCQAGVRWPGYGGRDFGRAMLAELGDLRGEGDASRPWLYDPERFFWLDAEPGPYVGSLALDAQERGTR